MIARLNPAGQEHTIVVAIGGNALQAPGERGDIHEQFAHTRESMEALVALAREGWHLAVVHGNGPQVGDGLLRNELARHQVPPLPLGVLVAATAGWIGYMIQQSLQNALALAGVDRPVATVVTQVIVDPDDPSMREPSKPIGRVMDAVTARKLSEDMGWTVAEQGSGWRRVVPSPRPTAVVEAEQVRRLVEDGTIVVALGGGGTPVYAHPELGLEGVDAVVDKDRAAAVLAHAIRAELLLVLTNVDGVYRDFGRPGQRLIERMSVAEAEALLASGDLAAGSMRPKVEAAVDFVRGGGGRACIARLGHGTAAVAGTAGTSIVP
jgi:carbamate kinase